MRLISRYTYQRILGAGTAGAGWIEHGEAIGVDSTTLDGRTALAFKTERSAEMKTEPP